MLKNKIIFLDYLFNNKEVIKYDRFSKKHFLKKI